MCSAPQTQGMIGYWLPRRSKRVPGRTSPLSSARPSWRRRSGVTKPTKFVGPVYGEAAAEAGGRDGLDIKADGAQWRRVVPSPRPQRLLSSRSYNVLSRPEPAWSVAAAAGSPSPETEQGAVHGVEAVVDKDRTASLLGALLRADSSSCSPMSRRWKLILEPQRRGLRRRSTH